MNNFINSRARFFLALLFLFYTFSSSISASDQNISESNTEDNLVINPELNGTQPRYFYHSEIFIRDEVIFFPDFAHQVENMGFELKEKTGVLVKMLILKTTEGKLLDNFANDYFAKSQEPTIILGFTEKEKKVEIFASDPKLYEEFDKEQILSPYPWSGTILPILGEKIKKDPRNKYAVALFNGYADIVEQVANSRNVDLSTAVGSANKYVLNVLRLLFYGVIVIALIYYFYRKFSKKA